LDLLKETKKGFLQKMFPKNGAKVPEIRFPGFTKDWEERKLGDVFSERSERSSEGELISVTINSGVIKASELDRKDNSSDNKSNYKKVEVGDIAYNSMRMWQGASGYSSYEGILSPAYTVIIPKEGTDSKFFAYDFKRYDMIQTFKRNSQGLTSDTWNLKFPTLKLVKIMVPSIEEQKQIAAFFERLDNTIALHQRELDLLKETKKGFLQKMFV
ncbi:restriction endonuclease subunit S, partial [Enterococcus faecium]